MKATFSEILNKKLIIQTIPYLFASALITELFYKFGSFTLELIGFSVTWLVIQKVGVLITNSKNDKP